MRRSWTVRPVSYEEGIGVFRIVTDADGMGRALLTHCDPNSASFKAAAQALLTLSAGAGDPEQVRAAFIVALIAAGVYVRGET